MVRRYASSRLVPIFLICVIVGRYAPRWLVPIFLGCDMEERYAPRRLVPIFLGCVMAEFLKAADTQKHICAKYTTTCAKFWLLNTLL